MHPAPPDKLSHPPSLPPAPPPPLKKTLHNGSVVNWGIRYNRSYQSCRLLKWDLELVV